MLNFFSQDKNIEKSKNRHKIWREQVKLVAENAAISNIVSLVLAVILASVLWSGETPNYVMASWLAYMVVVAIIRVAMTYLNKKDETRDLFSQIFVLSILFTAAGWGFSAYVMFPEESVKQVVMSFILSGIAAGGVPVLSPMIRIYYAYAGLVLLPLSLKLAQMTSEYSLLALLVEKIL